MTFKQFFADVTTRFESPSGRKLLERLSRALLVGTVALLAYKLTQLGWSEIWRAVPATPWFYALFAVTYFLLPFSEALTYRLTWKFDFWRSLPAFFKKHVYNYDVLDYSGEVYLYLWGTKRLGRPDGDTLRTIKDNSILSSLCGYVVALVMPAVCFALGQLAPHHDFATHEIIALIAGPLMICGVCGLVLVLRRAIFWLPIEMLAAIGGIHLARFLLINVLTVVQWALVLPQEPLYVWCTLLAAQNLIGRLPSVLRKDLIFVAAGVELSSGLSAPAAAMAGMLLVNTVLDRLTNAAMFLVTALWGRGDQPQPIGERPAQALAQPAAQAVYENAA